MANVYRNRDEVAQGMVNSAIDKLKNPGGMKSHGFHDRAKPSLNSQPLPPLSVKPVSESVKKLHIDLPR